MRPDFRCGVETASDWLTVLTPAFSLVTEAVLILWTEARCRVRDFSSSILLHTGQLTCLEDRLGGEGGAVSEGVGRIARGGVDLELRVILASDWSLIGEGVARNLRVLLIGSV